MLCKLAGKCGLNWAKYNHQLGKYFIIKVLFDYIIHCYAVLIALCHLAAGAEYLLIRHVARCNLDCQIG